MLFRSGDAKPVTVRYADLLEPGLAAARAALGKTARSDEDVLSYIAFPDQALAFFKRREDKKKKTYTYSVEIAQ